MANRIEKLQKDVLRGVMGDEFKHHLVGWDSESIRTGTRTIKNIFIKKKNFIYQLKVTEFKQINSVCRRLKVKQIQ